MFKPERLGPVGVSNTGETLVREVIAPSRVGRMILRNRVECPAAPGLCDAVTGSLGICGPVYLGCHVGCANESAPAPVGL